MPRPSSSSSHQTHLVSGVRRRTAGVLALALAALAGACGGGERPDAAGADRDTAAPAAAPAPAETEVSITVPSNFAFSVFADAVGQARHIVVRPNGDVFVNTWRSPYDTGRRVPSGGFVVALRDTDRDGKADVVRRFGETRETGGTGGTGIALFHDALYVEAGPNILRYRLAPEELTPTGGPDTIVTGLTLELGHPQHGFAIDSSGNLFVNVGSKTNACQKEDRQRESPGLRPCRELETHAGIWRFSATKEHQRFSPAARYATGIRNANGLAIYPGTDQLYVTQHGRDQLGENWPKLFTWEQSAEQPAEELIRVRKGGDYGWPYCYYDPEQKKRVLAPEYGGDGKKVGECATKGEPVAVFPAHWAPNALVFYRGSLFPERYQGGAFLAFHGSWNRAPEPQEGYNVVFQPFAGGKPSGEFEVFADGFAGKEKQPGMATHRPAGLAVGPDGALYISDDQRGRIWRVTYAGQR